MGENSNENTLQIRMLGGLYMTYRGTQVVLGKNLGGKTLQLFLLLIYFRNEGIRRERLLEELYFDCDIEQASNSLRATLYRLRKSLAAAGLPGSDFVSTKGGIYRWEAEDVEIELDVEEFQKKSSFAMAETDIEFKLPLLEAACQMYRGEFLPMMIGEEWVSIANWKFQELYFKCLRELARLLKEQKDYRKLLKYCEQALVKYPYEEWQMMKIDCLMGMKEYKTALEYYNRVSEEYQKEFGMQPSDEMVQCYRSIRNVMQYEMNNIEDIQTQLRPDLETAGATRCDYLSFIDIFHYVVWVLERKRIGAFLVLYTLMDDEGVPINITGQLEDTRQALDKAISISVRKSDLYTRYGRNQFLILMVDTDRRGCEIACERVKSRFQNMNRHKKIDVYYTYQIAVDVAEDALRNNCGRGLKNLQPQTD